MSGETADKESGWTTDTLRAYIEHQFEAMYRLLDERKATSDEAGKVALAAQQTAMRTALEAAEKAVQTALVSAEKAVNKAEVAADKRFESMNEFRQQLNDQAATFMPRTEADIRISAVSSALTNYATTSDVQLREIRSALDSLRGGVTSTQRAVTVGISVLMLLVVFAGVLIALKP